MSATTTTKFFVQTGDPWGNYNDAGVNPFGGFDNVNDAKEAASKMPRLYELPPRTVKRVMTETVA